MRRIVELYEDFAELELPDARRAIDEVRPDVVIMDVQAEGGLYAAEASGLPFATYCPYPLPIRSRDAPPHGLGLAPARGPIGRVRDRLSTVRTARTRAASRQAQRDARPVGLPPLRAYDDQWLAADRFIALTAEPYEYPRSDWPPTSGSWVRSPGIRRASRRLGSPTETRPIVLVTASTAYQNDGRLICDCARGVRGRAVAWSSRPPPTTRRASRRRPTPASRRSLPHRPIIDARCLRGLSRRAGNHAEGARRRRPGLRGARSAATSSTSPAASRSPTPVPSSTTGDCRRSAFGRRSAPRRRNGPAPSASRGRSQRRAARAPPRTRWRTSSRHRRIA